MKRINLIGVLIMLLSFFLSGQDEWALDKAHSSVAFEVEHVVMLKQVTKEDEGEFSLGITQGKFKDFDIKFIQGHSDFTGSKIEAIIRVNSIDTGNELRDSHLKSESFFYVNRHPVILFQNDSFEKVDKNNFKVTGDLTICEVTRAVELDVQMSGEPVERSGNLYVSFTAACAINRYDYGLKWNEVMETGGFRVSNYVKITIQGNFIKEK